MTNLGLPARSVCRIGRIHQEALNFTLFNPLFSIISDSCRYLTLFFQVHQREKIVT